MRLDRTDTTQVSRGNGNLFLSPEWAPDGEYIVVSRSGGLGGSANLYMYHEERAAPIALPGGQAGPPASPFGGVKRIGAVFSPDGRHLWYALSRGDWEYNARLPRYQLYRYDRETGANTLMTNRYGSAMRPAISPDGEWLVYATPLQTPTPGCASDTWPPATRSGWPIPCSATSRRSRAPLDVHPGYAFLPDGSAIVVSYGGKIWNVPMDGGEPVEIPFEAEVEVGIGPSIKFDYAIDTTATVTASQIRSPVVSPDGDRIVFTAFDRLWIRDLPEGEAARLTDADVGEFHPQWSPDGTSVAYVTLGRLRRRPHHAGSRRRRPARPPHRHRRHVLQRGVVARRRAHRRFAGRGPRAHGGGGDLLRADRRRVRLGSGHDGRARPRPASSRPPERATRRTSPAATPSASTRTAPSRAWCRSAGTAPT